MHRSNLKSDISSPVEKSWTFDHKDLIAVITLLVLSACGFKLFTTYIYLLGLHPSMWPFALGPLILGGVLLWPIKYSSLSSSLIFLIRGLAVISGVYTFMVFPAVPVATDFFGGHGDKVLIVGWCLAWICALLTLWRPCWLMVPGFYIYWSKRVAGMVSGITYHTTLDIRSLWQISVFIVIELVVIILLTSPITLRILEKHFTNFVEIVCRKRTMLCDSAVLITISVVLSNYFYSGFKKTLLDGEFFSWPLYNNAKNIFAVALDNQQLLWGDLHWLTSFILNYYDLIRSPAGIAIWICQLAAVIAFFSKRLVIPIFIFYDLMHFAIFAMVGANFATWFALNLLILAVIPRLNTNIICWRGGMLSMLIVLAAPNVFRIAHLGWYDTLANNKTYFLAVDDDGNRTRVPGTYFKFYSYPIAHMSFGHPPGKYFPVDTNGGADPGWDFVEKARTCSFEPSNSPFNKKWSEDAVVLFIRRWHDHVLENVDENGHFSHEIYYHHWWNSPSVSEPFRHLDKRRIVEYILRIESVCLTPTNGKIERKVVHENEFRIQL